MRDTQRRTTTARSVHGVTEGKTIGAGAFERQLWGWFGRGERWFSVRAGESRGSAYGPRGLERVSFETKEATHLQTNCSCQREARRSL